MPNLKGWTNYVSGGQRCDGVLFRTGSHDWLYGIASGVGGGSNDFEFDASRYSSVYKDGLMEVRPSNVAVRFLIKY